MNEKIANDLKDSIISGDKFKLSVIMILKSSLQLEKINKIHDLTDDEVIAVIKKQVKMRKDSIAEFEKFGKVEEVQNLQKEIEILNVYLPEEMSEEQVLKVIDEVFNELKPTSMRDMGNVMKVLNTKITNADMSLVSKLVKERLS